MDEDATFNFGYSAQLVITQSSPRFWQRLSTLEALGGDWHGLNAPCASRLIWIHDIYGLSIFGRLLLCLEFKEMFLEEVVNKVRRTKYAG